VTVNRWDPFTALARLDSEFDHLVRRTWGSSAPAARRMTTGYVPPIEMRTERGDVVITLELPGIDVASDVEIEVAPGRLTISGQRREMTRTEDESSRLLVSELRSGSFRREFALPDGVTADDVEAAYDQGMLHVRVREVAKPAAAPTKVPIQSAAAGPAIAGSVVPNDADLGARGGSSEAAAADAGRS
jgi:HSP20 family protein